MRTSRIKVYVTFVTALAILALGLGSWILPSQEQSAFWTCFATFTALAITADMLSLRVQVGGPTAIISSVAFVPFLASIVLVGPSWAMLVGGITILFGESVLRRKPFIKLLHNTAKEILAIGSAGGVYAILGGVASISDFTLAVIPFAAAVVVYFAISTGLTTSAVAISTRRRLGDTWNLVVGSSLYYDLFSSSLALLLALLYVRAELIGFLFVILSLLFVRHTYHMNLQLEQANRDLLDVMVKAIEARDPYTSGHSQRVSECARTLARELKLPFRQVERIGIAALLHDVGKIFDEFAPLLRKVGKLSADEKLIMKSHPLRSAELVGTISALRGFVQDCVRHHHEHFDGTGYPYGLIGDDIPVGARIIMVADTADAMMTDRPYRKALTAERVVQELRKHSGQQFDPQVVEAFCRTLAFREWGVSNRPEPSTPPVPVTREREPSQTVAVR